MKKASTYRVLLMCILWIGLTQQAGLSQFRFTNYDYTNGLPITDIREFAEDSLGYLWMGSNEGLVRFDGLDFKFFEPFKNDSSSLYGSEIARIKVDATGKVWITFHDGGISIYDHTTQKFKTRHYLDEDGVDFPRLAISDFIIDNERSKIWMTSAREGVFEMDMLTLSTKKVLDVQRPHGIVNDKTSSQHFYLSSGGLWRVDKSTYYKEKLSEYGFNHCKMYGDYLIGYDWSLHVSVFNTKTREHRLFRKEDDFVNKGILLDNDKIWSTTFTGLWFFDIYSGKRTKYLKDKNNRFDIDGDHYNGIFKDSKDRIWIGSDKGLSVINPDYQNLIHLQSTGILNTSDIVSGPDSNIYYTLGFYDDHILEVDIRKDKSSRIEYSPIMDFIGPLHAIRNKDKVWVICHRGFGYFTDEKQILVPYDGGKFSNIIHQKDIGNIVLDDNDNIWLMRNRSSILVKIPTDGSEVDTFHIRKLQGPEEVKAMLYERKALWLGTDLGLCRYDIESGKQSWFLNTDERYQGFQNSIENIGKDNEGNIWVLSLLSGAYKCDYNKEKDSLSIIKSYFQEDGLANNRPWNISKDGDGILYFGSTSGMSVYHKEIDRMVSFDKQYGFKELSLNVKCLDDKVFILSRGLSYFNVNDVNKIGIPPKVKLTSISNGFNTFFFNSQNLSTEKFKFSHNENNVKIEFTSIDLSYARNINYRYRLDKNQNWDELNYNNREARFIELNPGSYNFEIAAAGKDRNWGKSEILNFTIQPAYWQTWWFKLLVAIGLIGIVSTFFKWRERQIRMISDMETRMTELENEALRAQMNPHFIFNSLNSIKSFIINNKREEAADYLTTFAELIRTILRNSKSKTIPLSEEVKALDLYMEIENIRLENKFDVKWEIDPSLAQDSILVPPLAIQPFVENAIWHGFVHKEGKGELTIKVTKNENQILINIIDDGIGREKSKMIEKKHFRKRSYGIAITKQRLGMKKDENIEIVDLKDQNGNAIGTEVTVRIPINTLN